MPGISRVRTSVVENALTVEQLEQRGITNASVAASFLADSKGWVAEHSGQIVAFAIADRASRSIFALFVLPEFEGRGIGGRLHDLAVEWLWRNGAGAHLADDGSADEGCRLLRAPGMGGDRRRHVRGCPLRTRAAGALAGMRSLGD